MPHMWMGHVMDKWIYCHACGWDMSHVLPVDGSCHGKKKKKAQRGLINSFSRMWIGHVTHVNDSCHTRGCAMSHMWMSHITRVNESYHTCEWVMSHVWMSHVMIENKRNGENSTHLSRIFMSHVTHVDESSHTREWVIPHMWMSHVMGNKSSATGTNQLTCHICGCVISHTWMSHVTHVNESCHGKKIKRDVDTSTHRVKSYHTCEWVTDTYVVGMCA